MTRQDRKAMHNELIEHGVPYCLAYRWSDGYVQRAYQPADDAQELADWVRKNSRLARLLYVRDLRTGRFCRV